jgi:hypothetical protein
MFKINLDTISVFDYWNKSHGTLCLLAAGFLLQCTHFPQHIHTSCLFTNAVFLSVTVLKVVFVSETFSVDVPLHLAHLFVCFGRMGYN